MKVYTLENIEFIHITELASLTGRSVTSTRYLIEKGNVVRKLKAYRDRSRLMIPLTELRGFPFVKQGSAIGRREIYHYVESDQIGCTGDKLWEPKICPICSFTNELCEERRIADEAVIPEGDK